MICDGTFGGGTPLGFGERVRLAEVRPKPTTPKSAIKSSC